MPSIIRQGTVYGVPAKLGGLTDVTLSTPTSGQSLVYDATLSTWINGEGGGKVWQGTQAQYDAIANPDPDTTYYITDTSPYTTPTAGVIYYDNTSSGLSANTVQGAIDEVDGKIFYGVCDTEPTVSGNERIWTVTLNNGDGFALTEGATVYIKFTHEETGTVYPTFPCLNVNDTGAKPIYMNYTSGNTGYVPRWREGQVCLFTYDGNNKWFQINSVQSAYLTPYSNSSSGLTATNVQSAIDEVNSNRAYAYRLTSTTSFYSACSGTVFTDNYGLGNFLDTKVHAVRNSFSTTAVNYIHDSVGGAIMFAQVFAYGASYYCGTVNTYHADNKIYGGLGFVNFQYMNGTYVIQYISNSRI